MCGRYTLSTDPFLLQMQFQLDAVPGQLTPRYNIAPGQDIPVIRQVEGLGRHLDLARWGLVPSWAKERRIGHRLINARAETVAEKPAFRAAFRHRRCLVPADGFYEWHRQQDGKQPYWLGFGEGEVFAFAGLWEHWEDPESGHLLESCAIITTAANATVGRIHERMPVILSPQAYGEWLGSETDWRRARTLLALHPAQPLHIHPVSRAVNSPLKDNPHLMEPVRNERLL